MNILGLDLNELVSKEVSERLSEMEETIQQQYKRINKLSEENDKLVQRLETVENTEGLLNMFKEQFNSLQAVKEDKEKDVYAKTIGEVRYDFFKDILSSLFNIPKVKSSNTAWAMQLAIHYYDHKDLVIKLLTLFGVEEKYIKLVNDYVLPKYWHKDQVMVFVKNPKYNTNGYMFGDSPYWSGGMDNLPYNQIMVNPLMVDEEVFAELINTIKAKRGEWYQLYAITRYVNLSCKQLLALGDTLLSVNSKDYSTDTITEFIRKNLVSFSKEVKDKLFLLIRDDNHYNLFHWENFPVEYQKQYLMNMEVSKLLTTLTHYSCKWSQEDKESFLKERYSLINL